MSIHSVLDKFDEVKSKITDKEYKNVTEGLQKVFKEVEKLKMKELYTPHIIKYAKCNLENFCLTRADIKGGVGIDICEYVHPFVCVDEKCTVPIIEDQLEGKHKKLTFNTYKPNIVIPSEWIFNNLATEYTEIIGEGTNLYSVIRRIPCEKILLFEIIPCK